MHDFFQELDGLWKPTGHGKTRLPIIGATALLLQTSYERGTKDSDVLETADIDHKVRAQLESLAGQGSKLHQRRGMYIEVVASGIPLLPLDPQWVRIADLSAILRHFDIDALHVEDVVVSKLNRFHTNDQRDVEAMVDLDLVRRERLAERIRSVIQANEMHARLADAVLRIIRNFNRVERDFFGVDETNFDIPSSIDY
jgi:hypothetical protein